ncbi:chaperonin GroES [Pilibacter termitis]|uniref:Co-chaperonin GroES n=1 Tax=Pilibacter termitis TaxID=263852 RepID=A0A1T4L2B9_9ENTE|nr:co-chaperone GroES [Pilibacter termitis]SJZ48741.1 chaperonin GroES [Pilibacter termitis]
MIQPLGNRVVLEVAKEEEKTVGGLVLASAAQEKPQIATVVAVGSGLVLENGEKLTPEVAVGDKVLFEKYAGVEVKLDNKEYLVVKESDIIGKLA